MRHLQVLLLSILGLCPAFAQTKVKIMPLGDSITHGDIKLNSYRRALWKKLLTGVYNVDFVGGQSTNYSDVPPPNPDFDLDHQGNAGRSADWLGLYVDEWATSFQPDIVLLHAGTNDLIDRESVESTRDDLGHIIDQLRSVNPSVKVLLAQLIPSVNENINRDITELNGLIAELAKQKNTVEAPVILVDQNTGFSALPGVDLYDNLHPNEQGEEKMAERWYQALKSVLDKPLPVSLVQFSAQAVPAGVQVQWTTASELNNAGFTIERSSTGIEFEPVGRVIGRGTTLSRHTYSYLDATPPRSVLYYRLRQTDTDGAVTFSEIVTVSNLGVATLEVSPVPTEAVLKVSGVSLNAEVTIWSMRGQLVYRQAAQSSQVVVDVSNLAPGVYQVRAGTQYARFIKQ